MVKDIVANRKRLSFGRKLAIARRALRENGPVWLGTTALYLLASQAAVALHGSMEAQRRRRGLPGLNSLALNRQIWEGWDWSAGGEEWTPSEAWKASLVAAILVPQIPEGQRVLEIGPGAGRWTGPLLDRAASLVGVDISAASVEACRLRFADDPRAAFYQTGGADLAAVADASIDRVWSFDVFVHINATEVAAYLAEIARVLVPGGRAILHHGGLAGQGGGWRSDLTAARMADLIEAAGLTRLSEITRWEHAGETHALAYGDVISVIARPG
ncbi:MAG: class I SAM-dependent methyltransferase [Pikeienuella sp.]